jgi:transcriptional regulator with XRE-family HTH domain
MEVGMVETIGDRIRFAREYFNDTHEGFAEGLGTTKNVLSKVESNKRDPSARMLSYLSSYYGVKENWLMTGEGDMLNKEFEQVYKLIKSYCIEAGINLLSISMVCLTTDMIDRIYELVEINEEFGDE